MGLLRDWLLRRYIMKLFIIHLLSWLSLLSNIAFAQFDWSEGLTGSTSFPDVAITSLGNLALFLTCLVRGRLHAEMGARDFLDYITGPKLYSIPGGCGLTTCRHECEAGATAFALNLKAAKVVMLSKHKPNPSMRQFMKYTSHVYGVPSIQLQSIPLTPVEDAAEICYCRPPKHACKCIVFNTVQDITVMLAERMPGTLKQLSDSKCLLPCLSCLINGCHGCNYEGLLHVEEDEEAGRKRLTVSNPKVWPVAAVCEILDTSPEFFSENERSCICIPTRPSEADKWTEMLISFLKTKDKDDRRVINLASDALQSYIAQCGRCDDKETYGTLSLMVPRLAEPLANIILTGWLRIDGFSSALVARRAIRDYIVDSRRIGIAANAFLSKVGVYSNKENTSVCQWLTFRGNFLSFGTYSIVITCVNMLCFITWSVLIALEGGADKWHEPEAMPLSKPIVYVITVAIGIGNGLSFLDAFILVFKSVRGRVSRVLGNYITLFHNALMEDVNVPLDSRQYGFRWIWNNGMSICMVCQVASCVTGAFEIWCFVLVSRGHFKVFGRWFYGALQALVWVRWAVGSIIFEDYSGEYDRDNVRQGISRIQRLSYASPFLLNAIFVGVRGKWKYLPS